MSYHVCTRTKHGGLKKRGQSHGTIESAKQAGEKLAREKPGLGVIVVDAQTKVPVADYLISASGHVCKGTC